MHISTAVRTSHLRYEIFLFIEDTLTLYTKKQFSLKTLYMENFKMLQRK